MVHSLSCDAINLFNTKRLMCIIQSIDIKIKQNYLTICSTMLELAKIILTVLIRIAAKYVKYCWHCILIVFLLPPNQIQTVWQDWAIFGLWVTFQSLWQQLICPILINSEAIFVKVSNSILFLVKSFLGNFYKHLAIFYGHKGPCLKKLQNILIIFYRVPGLISAKKNFYTIDPRETVGSMRRYWSWEWSCLTTSIQTWGLSSRVTSGQNFSHPALKRKSSDTGLKHRDHSYTPWEVQMYRILRCILRYIPKNL